MIHRPEYCIPENWDGYPESAWDRPSFALVVNNGVREPLVVFAAGPHVRYQIAVCKDEGVVKLGLEGAPGGLSVWEGVYKVPMVIDSGGGIAEGEPYPVGSFRSLTETEAINLRNGELPWNDNDWRR